MRIKTGNIEKDVCVQFVAVAEREIFRHSER
jgi:hypothetical protein